MRLACALGLLGVLMASGCLRPRQDAVRCGREYCPEGSSCKDGGGCLCNTAQACGDRCQPCPPVTVANAVPACLDAVCDFDCQEGYCKDRLKISCIPRRDDPNNCGACGTSCRSGICNGDTCMPEPFQLAAARFPANLALGPDSTYLYYTDAAPSPEGAVVRINLTNTSLTNSLSGRTNPYGIAVDATGVYWTERSAGGVFKAPLDLSGMTPVAAGQNSPYAIALDNQYVFWTNEDGNAILRLLKSSGTSEPPDQILGNVLMPHGIVVSLDSIYSANFGEGTVISASLAGTNRTLVRDQLSMPEALAVNGGSIYVTTASTVSRVTGGSFDVATGQNGPTNLVIDASSRFVYWTNRGTDAQGNVDGSVMKAPLSGGPPVLLARKPSETSQEMWATKPWGIAVDNQYVYWTTNIVDGKVWRLEK